MGVTVSTHVVRHSAIVCHHPNVCECGCVIVWLCGSSVGGKRASQVWSSKELLQRRVVCYDAELILFSQLWSIVIGWIMFRCDAKTSKWYGRSVVRPVLPPL